MSETEGQPTTQKPKRRWFRVSRRRVLLAIAVALVSGLAFHYRFHLLWRFGADRAQLSDVQGIPAGPMPEAAPPEEWVRCRFGSMSFDTPPGMVKNLETAVTGATLLALHDGSRSMIVQLPFGTSDESPLLETASAIAGKSVSLETLRLASCRVSSDDFRWSMRPDEVRWHTFCVCMTATLKVASDGWVETLFRDDLEGIAHFNTGHAWFDWRSSDGAAGGYIHFKDSGGRLDPTWVRSICHSLRFSGEVFPDRMPKEELLALFKVISK